MRKEGRKEGRREGGNKRKEGRKGGRQAGLEEETKKTTCLCSSKSLEDCIAHSRFSGSICGKRKLRSAGKTGLSCV